MAHEILVPCRFVHTGQTSRCFNSRALEHKRNIFQINNAGCFLYAVHSQNCNNCYVGWKGCRFLDKKDYWYKRLTKETLRITSVRNHISTSSLSWSMKRLSFFESWFLIHFRFTLSLFSLVSSFAYHTRLTYYWGYSMGLINQFSMVVNVHRQLKWFHHRVHH